jgi:hypothetical protein
MALWCHSAVKQHFLGEEAPEVSWSAARENGRRPPRDDRDYWRLAGGMMPFIRRYSTICP